MTRVSLGARVVNGLLAASVLFVLWTGWRVAQPSEWSGPADPSFHHSPPSLLAPELVSSSAVEAALDADPFRMDRSRPADRYVLPGDRVPAGRASARARPERPRIRLVGTVSSPGGGLAMVEAPGAAPRVLRVGQSIGGMRLESVSRGQATFVTSGGSRIVVRVQNGAAP